MQEQDDFDRDDYGDEDNDTQFNSLNDSASLNQLDNLPKNQQLSQSQSQQSNPSDPSSDICQQDQNYIQLLEDEPPFPLANQIRITNPYMSKYEKAMILGRRATQIENGSPIYTKLDHFMGSNCIDLQKNMIDLEEETKRGKKVWTPLDIAEKELRENKMPFIVRRYLPNGEFEDWKIQELIQ